MPIGTSYQMLKDIGSLGKRIFDKKIDEEVRKEVQAMIDKSSELYDRVVALEDDRQSNRQLISELQEKVKSAKNFNREFKKYEPQKLESGSFVYAYNTVLHTDKPSHYICAKCVTDSVISILQPNASKMASGGYYLYTCYNCGNDFKMNKTPPIKIDVPKIAHNGW
ncbi:MULTISPECIES: hypothetical protein [Morganellaceae]|uniref:hypothetical protein n=1 Tax=Morganellaceae TaxID=1903414 RepID=UPI001F186AFA|nr:MULTISPECIES: hypothetical protein [Morganellaceae]HCT9039926.1 hypothetical protein [Providencia rettgeri]